MGTATKRQTTKKSCWCNHCRREFPRRALDGRLLCADCQKIPGVRGYQNPNERGLQNGSPAYWEATKHQLNIITDGDERPAPPASRTRHTVERYDETRSEWVVEYDGPARVEHLGGTLKRWRTDVRRAAMSSDRKLLLLTLAEYADYDTEATPGGNVFPSASTLATMLGWSETRVRRTIGEVRGAWVTVCEVEAVNGRTCDFVRLSNLYVLRWPDGRRLSMADKRVAI